MSFDYTYCKASTQAGNLAIVLVTFFEKLPYLVFGRSRFESSDFPTSELLATLAGANVVLRHASASNTT